MGQSAYNLLTSYREALDEYNILSQEVISSRLSAYGATPEDRSVLHLKINQAWSVCEDRREALERVHPCNFSELQSQRSGLLADYACRSAFYFYAAQQLDKGWQSTDRATRLHLWALVYEARQQCQIAREQIRNHKQKYSLVIAAGEICLDRILGVIS
jgi:hypothetical protein